MNEPSYPTFGKIPRWDREVVITEKVDGTNGLVAVMEPGQPSPPNRTRPPITKQLAHGVQVAAGSRKRWLNPNDDNFGFAQWVWDNAEELAGLGHGLHYGEWYGRGINRAYGLSHRSFMLFNVARWGDTGETDPPKCCEVATVLTTCLASSLSYQLPLVLSELEIDGSKHVKGFPRPEGVVLYHTAGRALYKVTLDESGQTADGYVVRPAGTQEAAGVQTPEELVRAALQGYTNKNWKPPGLDQFRTELAVAA